MDRLKPDQHPSWTAGNTFTFQYGSIKADFDSLREKAIESLHSNMDRLKHV